ncbi:hypothetical protein A1342_12705 [Methylomonas methanica]|uniref:PEP-CTERM protein-sorting domain-containing protein n=2 Tax=Methylomonas TaxID=416 RepID=A0A126T2X0_9GAMM|nr:hypothetical protein JT25_007965 [Methylomonas denitrificans]OAH98685.1 hypothetical protein A1342_12705 [Methylomonas methanica]
MFALSFGTIAPTFASQIVVTFEDIGPSTNYQIPEGYGGISGWESTGQWSDYYGSSHSPALGDHFFHGWGGELSFDSAPVIFEGTYYNFWGSDREISYSLYYQGQLVYNEALNPTSQPFDPYWLASGYSGLVDKIYFYGTSDGIVIDNLTYTTAPVPLPGAALLFGSILAGFSLNASRRKVG